MKATASNAIYKITVIAVSIVLCTGCEGKQENKIPVYETNQYQTYRRLLNLCANSIEEGKLTMVENREELRYETKDIQLVMVNDEEAVKYQVYADGKEIHQFKRNGQNIESVSMTGITAAAYLDVTQDGVKDIVVIGEPPRGTLTGPHWIYLYDMENRKIISAFDESGALTEKQLDEIGKHLGKEFYETFPESKSLEACKQWGQPYIDKFGQLYYQTSIAGENLLTDIGEMLVMFSYDTLKESFEVCDVIYMPRFVEEEYDYANER